STAGHTGSMRTTAAAVRRTSWCEMTTLSAKAAPGARLAVGQTTKYLLSESQRQLLGLFQEIRFGRLHSLRVRNGEPDWSHAVRWTRTLKVLGENCPHPARTAADFVLKHEMVEFFRILASLGDAEIRNVEIRNGLALSFELDGASVG